MAPKGALHGAYAPVAQLDRVLPSEGRGHRFESCRVHQIRKNRTLTGVRFFVVRGRCDLFHETYESFLDSAYE